jgi:excisionase family DNA binding protein
MLTTAPDLPPQITGRSGDPFEPLTRAIEWAITTSNPPSVNSAGHVALNLNSGLTARISQVLRDALEAATEPSRAARMLLIQHLIKVENQFLGIGLPSQPTSEDALLSTAQAAEILGYSRPYVAMLIDQKKLAGATVSEGGHRRVPRASVMAWKDKHAQGASAHPRAKTRATTPANAAYETPEKEVMARIKALAI